MKALWWFKDQAIAGMARPGFNQAHWFDFPFQEAVVLGWVGQLSSGSHVRGDFDRHVQTYGRKIAKYYKFNESEFDQLAESFRNTDFLLSVLKQVAKRLGAIEKVDVTTDSVTIEYGLDRLRHEIQSLKSQGISRIVSLTELPHHHDVLTSHFDMHHFAIPDLGAPTTKQVEELRDVIQLSER